MGPIATSRVVHVPVSIGELFDKISILRIKFERLSSDEKRANVRRELRALETEAEALSLDKRAQDDDELALRHVNETLWDAEERLRALEEQGDFGPTFVAFARSVYVTNDERARIKSRINDWAGSLYREEKSYEPSRR